VNESRMNRAKEYVKEVLRGTDVPSDLQVKIAQIIIHAYFRGQKDLQDELGTPSN